MTGTMDAQNAENAFWAYQQARRQQWDETAQRMDHWKGLGGFYHRRLAELYRFLAPEGLRVLELGCAQGDLLASLKPSFGVGVDFSAQMLVRARRKHPDLHFLQADAGSLGLQGSFDIIILSDLLNDLWDVQTVFDEIKRLCTPRTRIILNNYSRLWELPLSLAEGLKLAKPTLYQNWLTVEDVENLLNLADFEPIRSWPDILWVLPTPLIDRFFNRFLVKLWPFKSLALTNFIVARPRPHPDLQSREPVVSVIVPARNEAGNMPAIIERIPEMGSGTEIVFVEGHSRDNTYEAIQQVVASHPERRCQVMQQTGKGKGDAVRLGFEHATGDVLMILDADMTVPPEDLPRFYAALRQGQGDFINGVRLVYPMEKQAMRFFNLLGNKFFSMAFSWLLGQPVKDTLCGTKVLWKQDYEKLVANRAYFGDFDPFGDFDLLFGAARMTLKIIDLPIRYRERTYGDTNIQRWRHGWLLLKMVAFAAGRIKFI